MGRPVGPRCPRYLLYTSRISPTIFHIWRCLCQLGRTISSTQSQTLLRVSWPHPSAQWDNVSRSHCQSYENKDASMLYSVQPMRVDLKPHTSHKNDSHLSLLEAHQHQICFFSVMEDFEASQLHVLKASLVCSKASQLPHCLRNVCWQVIIESVGPWSPWENHGGSIIHPMLLKVSIVNASSNIPCQANAFQG